jgi:hypothetical protein
MHNNQQRKSIFFILSPQYVVTAVNYVVLRYVNIPILEALSVLATNILFKILFALSFNFFFRSVQDQHS